MPKASTSSSGSASASAASALGVRQLLDLERALYQESIERAEDQREQLAEGTLEAFVLRCLPLETDRERELEAAAAQLHLNRRNALDLLEFELQAADDILRGERRALQQRLLAQAQRRVRHLERRQKQLDEVGAARFRPALVRRLEKERAKRKREAERNRELPAAVDAAALVAELDGAQKDAQRAFNFRHMRFAVPPPERIAADVGDTLREFSNRVAAVEGSYEMEVSILPDGHTLLCEQPDGQNATSFRVDNSVVVVSRLSEEEFHGHITAISELEVRVELLCGNKMRISLDRLRDGRCALRNLSQRQPLSPTRAVPPVPSEIRASPSGRRQAAAEASRRRRKTTVDIRRGF